MNTNEVLNLALARLQARTDTADLDAIAALNEALAEQPAPPQTGTLDKIFLDFIKKDTNHGIKENT